MSLLDFILNLPYVTIHPKEGHILASRMVQIKTHIGQFSLDEIKLPSLWLYYTLGALRHDVFLKRRVQMMRFPSLDTEPTRVGVKSISALMRLGELLLNTVILAYRDSELVVTFPEPSEDIFTSPKYMTIPRNHKALIFLGHSYCKNSAYLTSHAAFQRNFQ